MHLNDTSLTNRLCTAEAVWEEFRLRGVMAAGRQSFTVRRRRFVNKGVSTRCVRRIGCYPVSVLLSKYRCFTLACYRKIIQMLHTAQHLEVQLIGGAYCGIASLIDGLISCSRPAAAFVSELCPCRFHDLNLRPDLPSIGASPEDTGRWFWISSSWVLYMASERRNVNRFCQ